MRISILAALLLTSASYGKAFKIIAPSNPRTTTHQLTSGSLTIGITDNGGGVINQVILAGAKDIMGKESDQYGRAGQVAIRDTSHGGRYNPTQAGFNETLGTQCQITDTGDRLVVKPRGLALWHGDGQYDFTQWENIGDDPYKNDNGNSDQDDLDESALPGKQATEVHSEFDYFGIYENCMGKHGITTPVIRHYFEIRFIRPPGHCINQFREGTLLWNGNAARRDISNNAPEGRHIGTDKDMNRLTAVWSLRHDIKLWDPKVVYFRNEDGRWESGRTSQTIDNTIEQRGDGAVFILTDSAKPERGVALGLYRPQSDINVNAIVGVSEASGKILYKDDRRIEEKIVLTPRRVPTMSKYGFSQKYTGMLNRTRLDNGVYEAYRSEYYILSGTPKDIMRAVDILEALDD